MMRTAAMQVAITMTEIERTIAAKDHTGEGSANPPPRHGEPSPRMSNDSSSIRLSIQSKTMAQG